MRKGADQIGISLADTVVFGDCVLGLDPSGRLYRWMGGRWVALEPVSTGMRRASRVAAGLAQSLLAQGGR